MPTPESESFKAAKPKVAPTFDGVDYDDNKALKAAQDAIIREQWVQSMMARLIREEMGKCYYREGVNHLEKCGHLRGELEVDGEDKMWSQQALTSRQNDTCNNSSTRRLRDICSSNRIMCQRLSKMYITEESTKQTKNLEAQERLLMSAIMLSALSARVRPQMYKRFP